MENAAADAVAAERSLTFLNETGDVTITWTPEQDERMREAIQKKMNEGYSFFLVEKACLGLVTRKRRVRDVSEASAARKVLLRDADAERLIKDGIAQVLPGAVVSGDLSTRGRARKASEAASGHAVAVRPMRGG